MRRPLLGNKLCPSSSLGEQNRDVSAASCSSGCVWGGGSESGGDGFLRRQLPSWADRTDLEIFFSPMRLAAGFPPRPFLTQSVLQRVHHHLVDHQVPLIGSEREKHESEELFFGAPLNGCDNFDFGILKPTRLLGFVDTRRERDQKPTYPLIFRTAPSLSRAARMFFCRSDDSTSVYRRVPGKNIAPFTEGLRQGAETYTGIW